MYIYISLYIGKSIIVCIYVYIYMYIFKNVYICTYGTALQPRPGDGHGWSMWDCHFNKTITTTGFGGGYWVVAATPKNIEK
jgi:hypothetical protein